MCSTCECDDVETKLASLELGDTKCCRKCGSEPFIILDKIHIECKRCFLESCNKKVRSTIGKSKLLKNNDTILIAHSGGASSTALLDLIKTSMEYETRREQKFRPSILHIDTQSMPDPMSDTSHAIRFEKLKSVLVDTHKQFPGWPIYWTTIENSIFCASSTRRPSYLLYEPQDTFHEPKYRTVLNNAEAINSFFLAKDTLDLTDAQQYVQRCTIDLISAIALKINESFDDKNDCFKYLFSASSATQLANNLLVDVILGQGATIRSTVGVCDRRFTVPVVRAMRDFSKKEIAFYLKAKSLNFHVQTNQATFADRKASIHKVTEAFLSKLYVDYPSTYSTLLKTGNKMQD